MKASGAVILSILLTLQAVVPLTAATRTFDPAVFVDDQRPPDERLAYKEAGGISLPMAVFLPKDRSSVKVPRPAILLIHGGAWSAWKGGDRATWNGGVFAPHARYFAARGMVAATISYRHIPPPGKESGEFENGNALADLIADCRSAMRFLRVNADRFGIDPSRITALGDSAGGHLAAALGTIDRFDHPGDDLRTSAMANLVIPCNPITDLTDPRWFSFIQKEPRSIEDEAGREERAKAVSPLWNVSKNSSPTLAIHGLADAIVEPRHSSELISKLQQAGVPSRLKTIDGAAHAFVLLGYRSTGRQFLDVMCVIDSFLADSGHLQGQVDFASPAPRGLLTHIPCDRIIPEGIPGTGGARLIPPDSRTPGVTSALVVDDAQRGKVLKIGKGKEGLTLTGISRPGSATTISLWIRPDARTGTLFSRTIRGNTATGCKLAFDPNGRLSWQAAGVTLAAPAPPLGTWSHVAASVSPERTSLWINGLIAAEQPLENALLIGNEFIVADSFSGLISDLRLHDDGSAPAPPSSSGR